MPWGGRFLPGKRRRIRDRGRTQSAGKGRGGCDHSALARHHSGLTIELVRRWVGVVHDCGLLAETTIGTSQEEPTPTSSAASPLTAR